jgi:hypothetical protein
VKNFTDSKFWISLIATLVALGILQLSESEQAQLVQAIVTVAGAAAYIVSVAIAQAQRVQTPEVTDRNLLTDAWQRMSVQQAEAHKAASQDYGVSRVHVEAMSDALVAAHERLGALEARLDAWEADS